MKSVLIVFILSVGILGTSKDHPSDVRIEKTKPTVFILFERSGERKPLYASESDKGIWLRLCNNTKWPIILDVHGVPSDTYGDSALIYDVLLGNQIIIPDSCHACSFNALRSGHSLLFTIPAEHLSNGRALRIKFSYRWEDSKGVVADREPEHYVYFYSSELPKTLAPTNALDD